MGGKVAGAARLGTARAAVPSTEEDGSRRGPGAVMSGPSWASSGTGARGHLRSRAAFGVVPTPSVSPVPRSHRWGVLGGGGVVPFWDPAQSSQRSARPCTGSLCFALLFGDGLHALAVTSQWLVLGLTRESRPLGCGVGAGGA